MGSWRHAARLPPAPLPPPPYFPLSNPSPSTQAINAALDFQSLDYAKWREQFLVILGKYAHRSVPPDSSDLSWQQTDYIVLSWIAIEYFLRDNGKNRAIQLEVDFRSLSQGSMKIIDYCLKLKTLADSLVDIGQSVSEETLILQTIHGLNDDFATFISMQTPLTSFSQTCSMLILEETRRANSSSNPVSALTASPKPKPTPLPPASASPPPKPTLLPPASAPSSPKPMVRRLFGRQRPVHQVLGGGLAADVILWRDKKFSGGVLGFITAIWILFELLNYHLLTLIARGLIFALTGIFLWSNAKTFKHKSPPEIPVVSISEDHTVYLARRLVHKINLTLAVLRNIALGRDLKNFLGAIAGLWIISIVASWVDFLTLFYILLMLLHTVPVFYDKYADIVDPFAEKALAEANRNFTMNQAKVMERIPGGTVNDKKQ